MLALVAGCGSKPANETGKQGNTSTTSNSNTNSDTKGEFKVALIAPGAVNDGGWNASALQGLNEIQAKLGAKIAYTEKVAPANYTQVIRTYARQGYNLIFGHSFDFDEAMKSVAPEFPNTQFVVINGSVTGPNLASTSFKFGELGYFTGMTAGLITKSNKVGVVAPMAAPTVTADIDTFKEGVAKVNPKASVAVSYVGSWEDIPKAKEAAKALLSQGNDVLLVMGNSFSIGVFQACKDANAKAIGWVTDQNFMAPDTIVTSGLQSVEALYLKIAETAKKGKLEPQHYVYGMKDGAQSLAPFKNVPQDVVDKVQSAVKDYLDGKFSIKTLY
ncbi:BMP family protein [Neomoorella glycerini]|uniref:BMP family protein n=1 Tax=Neomoorella glycerini TaxID=55779 RepID=UPI0014793B82|nr:BMP family protein [Moorella glycerini]